jgi:hypothetical protein
LRLFIQHVENAATQQAGESDNPMIEPKEIVAEGHRLDIRRWASTPEGQAGLKEFWALVLPTVLLNRPGFAGGCLF